MDINHVIFEIEKIDPEIHDRLRGRRSCLKRFAGLAGRAALVSLPIALGSVFKKAYGQSPADIVEVLNFILTLEYLEAGFYAEANASQGLIPAGPEETAFATIASHESAHVEFLKAAITASGGTAVPPPGFDFTAGGTFSDVFSNYETFLAVAQVLEDTGVRGYKGQAGNLTNNKDVLTAALDIHSVEARHASYIRKIRKTNGVDIKPWITGNNSGIGPAVQAAYEGEENTGQGDIEIVDINYLQISGDAASEAFDEPLTKEEVLSIVSPFMI